MDTIDIADFAKNIDFYFDEVSKESKEIAVSQNGNIDRAVVMLSLNEYNSFKETEYLLSTAINRKRLAESLLDSEKGNTISFGLNAK